LLGSVKRIQAPLFLLYGGRDAIVKPAQAAEMPDAAPPHATFSIVPGASHLTLFLRRDVQERIARWFASQLQG
ncbi:alpha/beta hydrolase, partial [Kouleothrix aurantiaca]